MNLRRFARTAVVIAALTCSFAVVAQSTAWPTRPVNLEIPFAAGGPTDLLGRAVAQALGTELGTTVVVENRTGAGGTLAAGYVARAAPDGYTLLLHHIGMSTAPSLYRKLTFDPLKDFEYIGQVADVPMTVLGRPTLDPTTPAQFIAYMKLNGDKINLAHAGVGAASHLCGMLLQQSLGMQATTVPFQGTGPAMTALMGGQVDVMCDQTMQTMQYIRARKVKAYGVTTAHRLKQLPEYSTLQEAGLKDFEVVVWHGLYAPKNTPPAVLARLNTALRKALASPDLQRRLDDVGVQVVAENLQTPDGLRNHLSSEIKRWSPLIKAAGAYAD